MPDDLLVRATWIQKMQAESADFIGSTQAAEKALETEIANSGAKPLVAHLRLCGVIPELFDHDSTPEKLYSKYTDAILCETFRFLGLNSVVITGRADVADVEAVSTPRHYDLVADAKAFRLTRTAKNQKDFKITALHKWKYGKKYATVVCPIYQLPSNKSQIYEQATSLDVCILSYSHLATIVNYQAAGHDGDEAFHGLLDAVSTMNPSSSSVDYWTTINKALLGVNKHVMPDLWRQEKLANLEGIGHAKVEGLTYLSAERTRLMSLTHDEAIRLLVTMRKIDAREKWIKDLKDNQLLSK
ncbi:MAG: HindIII family type II restriction endonuclease [Mycobacterium sp.]|nr:HindIII family type II restriction endonuclease [Mycobacterium sp.]